MEGFGSSVVNSTNHAYSRGLMDLLDCLIFVIPCPNCGIEGRLLFSRALKGQEVRCTRCNSSVSFGTLGRVLPRLEEAFVDVESVVTEKGGWIDISLP